MSKTTAKDVLTGSFARVFFKGNEIATFTNITMTITPNYEDVQIGLDVDRTLVSWTGEGSLTPEQRLTTFINYLLSYGKAEFNSFRRIRW